MASYEEAVRMEGACILVEFSRAERLHRSIDRFDPFCNMLANTQPTQQPQRPAPRAQGVLPTPRTTTSPKTDCEDENLVLIEGEDTGVLPEPRSTIPSKRKYENEDSASIESEGTGVLPKRQVTIFRAENRSTGVLPNRQVSPAARKCQGTGVLRKRKAQDLAQDQDAPRKRQDKGRSRETLRPKERQFGDCVSGVFLAWEAAMTAQGRPILEAYEEARCLLPEDGPGSAHHEAEWAAANQDRVKYARKDKTIDELYYTLKYRAYLSAAMFTERNLRVEQAGQIARAQSNELAEHVGPKDEFKLWSFHTTQLQMCFNRDSNRVGPLLEKWKQWDWIPEMWAPEKPAKSSIHPDIRTAFSKELRDKLMDELAKYEDEHWLWEDLWPAENYPVVPRNRLE